MINKIENTNQEKETNSYWQTLKTPGVIQTSLKVNRERKDSHPKDLPPIQIEEEAGKEITQKEEQANRETHLIKGNLNQQDPLTIRIV